MKKLNLLMLLLLLATIISAQTFDLGEGRRATLDQAGNYRLTWNQKSQNGGSVSGTFSGKLKDGKRDGVWKGSFTYQLFSSNEGLFKSGTINFTRTYTNGVPNGAYSYNSTLKVCSGSYNYLSKQWKYGSFESFTEKITGSFKNGHADGQWFASQQQPYEKITMQFDNGKAIGTWTISEKTSQTLGFKNGYLVQQKEMQSDGWGTELSYAPEENLEKLPNQKTVKVADFLAYGDYYMKGAEFDSWWRLYPENSSNEDYTAYYILADYDNHLKYIGNVPEWKKEEIERNKVSKVVDEIKLKDQQYAAIIQDSLKAFLETVPLSKREFAESIGCKNYYSCLFINEFSKRHPEYKEFAFTQFNEQWSIYKTGDLLRKADYYAQEKENYDNKIFKIIEEAKKNHVSGTDEQILEEAYKKYINRDEWFKYLHESNNKYQYDNVAITEEDICAYLCYKFVVFDAQYKTFKITAKDASDITHQEIKDWVFKYDRYGDTKYDKISKEFSYLSNRYSYSINELLKEVRNKGKFKKLLETVQR